MQAVCVEIEDWEEALSRIRFSEAGLLRLINERLRTDAGHLACQITALRYVERDERNWEVAEFVLELEDTQDLEKRIDEIGAFVAVASEGMDVDWPSTAIH